MPAARIPRSVARGKPKRYSRRRLQHLAFVRQLPCVACGKTAPSHAAHVRTGTDGGVAMKPGDRYAVSLCSASMQNSIGSASSPFGRRYALTLSMWLYGYGLYPPTSRPESARSLGLDKKSTSRKDIPDPYRQKNIFRRRSDKFRAIGRQTTASRRTALKRSPDNSSVQSAAVRSAFRLW